MVSAYAAKSALFRAAHCFKLQPHIFLSQMAVYILFAEVPGHQTNAIEMSSRADSGVRSGAGPTDKTGPSRRSGRRDRKSAASWPVSRRIRSADPETIESKETGMGHSEGEAKKGNYDPAPSAQLP